jgi:hypothetical protein
MHDFVKRINDPKLCYVFAQNAINRGHADLATQAYRRAVDLRAEQHTTESEAEHVAVRAIYAYEEALSYRKGKRTRATGTWLTVSKKGIFNALVQRIESSATTDVASVLQELGMEDYSFTAAVAAYPDAYIAEAA